MILLRKLFNTNLFRVAPLGCKVPCPGDATLVMSKPEISHLGDKCASGPEFDQKLISYLESLSILRFDNEQAVAYLRTAVKKSSLLRQIDCENVEVMYTVWKERECPLHEDIPEEPLNVEKVLSNAVRVQDDYFICPPGNMPLEESATLDLDLINQWDRIGVPIAPMPKERKINAS